MIFEEGCVYSPVEICRYLGGATQQTLPMRGGCVTSIFLPYIEDDEKGLPYIQINAGKNSVKAALALLGQDEGVPAFRKTRNDRAIYIGVHTAVDQLMDKDDIEYYRYTQGYEISSILLLHKVEKEAPSENRQPTSVISTRKPTLSGAPKGKWCKGCEIIKSRDQFHNSKKNDDGLTIWCRSCLAEKHAP